MTPSMGNVGWVPTSEEELLLAAENGILEEGATRMEFKRQLNNGPDDNPELARDLASLAPDGGVFIVGIVDSAKRDPKDATSVLHPVALAGLPERVAQIALTRCDPPLIIKCTTFPSTRAPGKGYLVAEVPPSTKAPHMVDGKYWGRSDRTKRQLTDSEVVLWHQQRALLDQDASAALQLYRDRDPWVLSGRPQAEAHLFIVAEPRPGRQSMLLDVRNRSEGSWARWLQALVGQRQNDEPRFGAWTPDFDQGSCSTRGGGWALTSYQLDKSRMPTEQADESDLIEIELSEDGAIRVFCGRASERSQVSGTKLMFDVIIAGLTYRTVQLAADVSTASGYGGEWAFGIGLTTARGAVSELLSRGFRSQAAGYPDDEYSMCTRASMIEIQDHAGGVVDRLVGRLLRTLGAYEWQDLDIYIGRSNDQS